MDYRTVITDLIPYIIKASLEIKKIYRESFDVTIKSDGSPLTKADLISNEIIVSGIRHLYPEYSILSEEMADDRSRLENDKGVFIIDPLDGTQEYVEHIDEFCVSIALAVDNEIVCGMVSVPTKDLIYYASSGHGSYRVSFDDCNDFRYGIGERIHVSRRRKNLIMLLSRSHLEKENDEILSRNAGRIKEYLEVGSCLKGCMIAEGSADVHYKLSPGTKEWDTAGIQIIVTEAGGIFEKPNGEVIKANREDFRNTDGYMILNSRDSRLFIPGQAEHHSAR